MLRNRMIALAAVVVLAMGFASTKASAFHGGGGFHGGGFHGGGFHGGGFHGGFRGGWGGWGWWGWGPGWWGYPYGYYPYGYYPYAYGPDYGGCYQVRRVHTSVGWRWRRVWVCG